MALPRVETIQQICDRTQGQTKYHDIHGRNFSPPQDTSRYGSSYYPGKWRVSSAAVARCDSVRGCRVNLHDGQIRLGSLNVFESFMLHAMYPQVVGEMAGCHVRPEMKLPVTFSGREMLQLNTGRGSVCLRVWSFYGGNGSTPWNLYIGFEAGSKSILEALHDHAAKAEQSESQVRGETILYTWHNT